MGVIKRMRNEREAQTLKLNRYFHSRTICLPLKVMVSPGFIS
jgi:hypothetical protein